MAKKTSEEALESQIVEDFLVKNSNYIQRNSSQYNRELCIDEDMLYSFIVATQPEEWEKLRKQHGENVKDKFIQRVYQKIEREGTLHVLRKGIMDLGCHFDLFYPKPSTSMNETYKKKYEANMFSVTRQVYFSEKTNQSLDLVLFINGLPIISIELKNQLSGQNVWNAINQYRADRDPKEPLFKFKRLLVNFAVDEDLVYMATKLQKDKTFFLPFNKGDNGGAGNPQTDGFKTEYLWKEILQKDMLSELIKKFINFEDVYDDNGKPTGEQILIFPRYHQLDAVRKIIFDIRERVKAKNYLIQHSAGSGKSNTIAWTAHQLSELHNKSDEKIFDSVIIVTDRRILDRQLQRTVQQFEMQPGIVKNIENGSKELREALEAGKKIIITTMQKFPQIVESISQIPGSNFAVLIDEAHSSQSGEMSKNLKLVLKASGLEEAEKEDLDEETWEDKLNEILAARGKSKNISFIAFTATPKDKTFQIFGEPQNDGTFEPFHLYTMRQAIEEKFILDVLKNYINFKVYYSLLKNVKDDPKYDKKRASALLRSFVDLHPHSIEKKVKIIINHFNDYIKDKIPTPKGNGQAKAMIVTRSRLHALKYYFAVKKYLKEQGYDYKALVAFSGKVEDQETGKEYSESELNGFPEKQIAQEFKKSKNKILIVANKFQTGFDQPLLYAMYVDKKLANVAVVQTLSRLNRTYKNKKEPVVLDFANRPEDIEEAFQKYYDKTILEHGTDPNKLYDLKDKIDEYYIITNEDINKFAQVFFDKKLKQDKLQPILNEVAKRYMGLPEDKKDPFKKLIRNFNRTYSFLSQVITFQDAELEKQFIFQQFLIKKLPSSKERIPLEVLEQVDMDSYRIAKTKFEGIKLKEGQQTLKASESLGSKLPEKEKEHLSKIVETINDRFATDFTDEDKVRVQELQARIELDPAFRASVKVNTKEKVKLTFADLFEEKFQDILDENFNFYKKVNDDKNLKEEMVNMMFEILYKKIAENKV